VSAARFAPQLLAGPQLWKDEPRLPLDAVIRDRHLEVAPHVAEHARAEHDRHCHLAVVEPVGIGRIERRDGGRRGGALVRAPEALERVAVLGRVGEQPVHRAEVAARPRLGEVGRRALRRAVGRSADEGPGDERECGECGQRGQSPVRDAPSARWGDALHS
jgi:hypothetical protein